MATKKNLYLARIIVCVLVISLLVPIGARAATPETATPYASAYLASYTAYICPMGDGELQIWYRVTGTGTWADLGVLSIFLYESTDSVNWYWVKTFRHTEYDNMLASNEWQHMSHVDYEGIPGYYYKAYVCIWAGPEDGGDSRYIWTDVERCT